MKLYERCLDMKEYRYQNGIHSHNDATLSFR